MRPYESAGRAEQSPRGELVISQAARNQIRSGVLVSWKIVPAVSEAWWPH